MAADDESTRGTIQAIGGVILAAVAGWFGLRKQQVQSSHEADARKHEAEVRRLESEVLEHELDSKDRQRLGTRIARLEFALDAKDEQIRLLQDKLVQLSDDRGRLQLDMGKAIAKCGGCSYCNCGCSSCSPCTNRKPKGGPDDLS